jgi:RNA-directed DNA polymerase
MYWMESWLKAGMVTTSGFEDSSIGVPQGGVISPLLCTITLNGMEEHVQNVTKFMVPKRQRTKVYVIRYADDFLATAANETIVAKVKSCVEEFLEPRGLMLHPDKTRIVELDKGSTVEFLGFALTKRPLDPRRNQPSAKNQTRNRLIIRPSRDNIKVIKTKVSDIIKSGRPIGGIIKEVNPKLRGWANYFRVARHSSEVFKTLGNWVCKKMLLWAQNKHTNRNVAWIRERYISKSKWRSNHWTYKSPKGDQHLLDISTVKYQFVPTLAKGLNPYLSADRDLLDARAMKIALGGESGIRKALLIRDNARCLVCGTSLLEGSEGSEGAELHHLKPQRDGGDWSLRNLILLHATCHKKVTYDEELNISLKSQIK